MSMAPAAKHILIVDDNQEILDVLTLMPERQSYQISAQVRVGDFIHEIRELLPDLILMDQHLGWANGCDLCAVIKSAEDLQLIPVIMFSAYHKAADQCLFAGADAFAKPFKMDELLALIARLTTTVIQTDK